MSQRQGFCYTQEQLRPSSVERLHPDVSRDFTLTLQGVEISIEGQQKFFESLDKGVKSLKNCAVGKLKSLAEAHEWTKEAERSVHQWFDELYEEFEHGRSSAACGCKTASGGARELGKCTSCLTTKAFSPSFLFRSSLCSV